MKSIDLGNVRIVGLGMTKFQHSASVTADDLAVEAASAAISDAGIMPHDIDNVFVGHVFGGRVAAQRILRGLGIQGLPTINVENACASGASALRLAIYTVATGMSDVALAVGFDKLSHLGSGVVPPDTNELEGTLGRTNPSTYALMAKRYLAEYGTSPEVLAHVAVKARTLGVRNPRAQVRREITVEEVLSERMIADPLTRLECCPTGDGAAAAIVTTSGVAGRLDPERAVKVLASALRGGVRRASDDRLVNHPLTGITVTDAYSQAGIGADDLDIVELHDAFAIAELVHMEDLGLCKRGTGGDYFMSGATMPEGERPVNVGGGLLARGHPLGATGLAQVVELGMQLRGEAGVMQVDNPKIALAQCEGGVVYGLDAGVCAIHILAV